MPDLASATADDFEPATGQSFSAQAVAPGPGGGEPFTLVLSAIRRREVPPGYRAAFSLDFLGPPSPVYPQGIYRVSHPEVGTLDLFVVPVQNPGDAVLYEVVFG